MLKNHHLARAIRFDAIFSLDEMPTRCPLIPEAEEIGYLIRHLLYGKPSGTYRIIFDIQETAENGSLVRILRIRHGAQDRMQAEDLEEQNILRESVIRYDNPYEPATDGNDWEMLHSRCWIV